MSTNKGWTRNEEISKDWMNKIEPKKNREEQFYLDLEAKFMRYIMKTMKMMMS